MPHYNIKKILIEYINYLNDQLLFLINSIIRNFIEKLIKNLVNKN